MKIFLLIYDYVDNMIERRAPYRDAHLSYLDSFVKRGEVLIGGPLVEPVDGAATVFKAENIGVVEQFVKNDPYSEAGLIKSFRIKEWMVLAGAERLETAQVKAAS